MGKGTIGLNPFYHDGTIMSHGAMAGLLSVIISFTDAKSCELLSISSGVELGKGTGGDGGILFSACSS
jgi:hypothetical protein